MGADSCLLVFDEIDAGNIRKVADMVGAKIKDLASHFRSYAFRIWHRLALMPTHILLVRKSEQKDRTESSMRRLNAKESIEELARDCFLVPKSLSKSVAIAKAMVGESTRSFTASDPANAGWSRKSAIHCRCQKW